MKTYLYVLDTKNKIEINEDEALIIQNDLFKQNYYSWIIIFNE